MSGNSGSYNSLEATNVAGGQSVHKHNVQRPFTYSHDFKYQYAEQNFDMSGVSVYMDVDISDAETLNELTTPFILVEYLIKF